MDEEVEGKSRRAILKTFGATGIGTASFPILSSVNVAADEIGPEWDCGWNCEDSEVIGTDKLDDLRNGLAEGSFSAHHFKSSEKDGVWSHDIGISGAAAVDDDETGRGLHGQKYAALAHEDYDGNVWGMTNNDQYGQYPDVDDDSTMPDWAQPLLEEAIGTINLGAGWFRAVGQSLNEAMGIHPDGIDLGHYDRGFRYRNTNRMWQDWMECCFMHRIKWETPDHPSKLVTYGGFADEQSVWGTTFQEIWFEIEFKQSKSLTPRELSESERQEKGIKKVPEDADITVIIGGDEVRPDYITTTSPLEITEIKKRKVMKDEDGNIINEEIIS